MSIIKSAVVLFVVSMLAIGCQPRPVVDTADASPEVEPPVEAVEVVEAEEVETAEVPLGVTPDPDGSDEPSGSN